jgi:hypothetical protein
MKIQLGGSILVYRKQLKHCARKRATPRVFSSATNAMPIPTKNWPAICIKPSVHKGTMFLLIARYAPETNGWRRLISKSRPATF